jgi:hypothetical protein
VSLGVELGDVATGPLEKQAALKVTGGDADGSRNHPVVTTSELIEAVQPSLPPVVPREIELLPDRLR